MESIVSGGGSTMRRAVRGFLSPAMGGATTFRKGRPMLLKTLGTGLTGVLIALSGMGPLLPEAKACGGVTATIADDPQPFGVRTVEGPRGIILHTDREGHVFVAARDLKIGSALAEAIAKRYLEKRFGHDHHVEFEGFTYEHGDLVYMYHAHVPGLAYSVHVGPVRYVTDHAHVHVSATTGDVYGPGCGGGPGEVEVPFEPTAYPADLKEKRLPYVQFDTPFVAREGRLPRIDGRIDPEEWKDAGHEVIHVGTLQKTVMEYG